MNPIPRRLSIDYALCGDNGCGGTYDTAGDAVVKEDLGALYVMQIAQCTICRNTRQYMFGVEQCHAYFLQEYSE